MKGSLSVIEKGKVRSITIALSRHERDLIAKHGYPFDGIEKQIELAGDKDICPITDEPYWWEQVVMNLGMSAREPERANVIPELKSLIIRLSNELGLPI